MSNYLDNHANVYYGALHHAHNMLVAINFVLIHVHSKRNIAVIKFSPLHAQLPKHESGTVCFNPNGDDPFSRRKRYSQMQCAHGEYSSNSLAS